MNRTRRLGRLGALAVIAAAATPFAVLWAQMGQYADAPTAQARLDLAIWLTVFATPAMVAAWLLWRAWWRQAGDRVASLDGPGWLLAAAVATLPAHRRDWGQAMAAELIQVEGRGDRWRFAAGCARTAAFPPGGTRTAVAVTGVVAVVAVVVMVLATGAALPAGRVFAPVLVALLGVLFTVAVARSYQPGEAGAGGSDDAGAARSGPGPVVIALVLAGVVACVAATTYYLVEHPSYQPLREPGTRMSLTPVSAVVLAVVLAGCLWLAVRPPRWLLGDRLGRRFGIAMAVVLVVGFVLASRQELAAADLDIGMMEYLFFPVPMVLLVGSAAAAAVGRSFRAGLWACAWAVVLAMPLLVAAWLTEALVWYQRRGQLLLDGEGGPGLGASLVGVNLSDAIWWTLVALALWALPLGVLGAAAGSWRARRRRAREHTGLAPIT